MLRSYTLSLLLIALLLTPSPLQAQAASGEETESGCEVGELDMSTADATDSASSATAPPASGAALSPAEQRVQTIIRQDGIHVVHLWAPWCSNSTNELDHGWDTLIRQNEDLTFTFVTIWNEGEGGAQVLDTHDLPDRVIELTAPGGSETNEADRVTSFLNLPVTWIPTTWIFHNNGELAFAMNYGEMQMETIQHLIDVTRKAW